MPVQFLKLWRQKLNATNSNPIVNNQYQKDDIIFNSKTSLRKITPNSFQTMHLNVYLASFMTLL